MTDPDPRWSNLDFGGLRERLQEVQHLLRQAAAVGAATDLEKLKTLERAHEKRTEVPRGRRRYR